MLEPERLPVVVLTTFFPNPRDPHRTVFVRNLVDAMRPWADVTVVAPVPKRPPWGGWRDAAPVPAVESHAGFTLHHPRFLSIPGLHAFAGLGFALAALPVLRELRRTLGRFVVHAHCAYPDAVGAAVAARLLGLPLVVTVHGSDINVVARRALLRPQIRWALTGASRVIAVSRALTSRVLALTHGAAARHVLSIPCAGYSPAVFFPRQKPALRESLALRVDGRTVVFVGQLVPVKGLDVLLQAWAALRIDAQLVLIGSGPLLAALQQLARDLRIDAQVRFLGALPQASVADWVGAADLLCLPSHSEGMPNVIVEALASGVPVVASQVGGIPELVQEGVNGLLVPPGDASRLAEALAEGLAARWDAEAIAQSVCAFTWESLAERNVAVLAAVAREAGLAGGVCIAPLPATPDAARQAHAAGSTEPMDRP